MLIIGAVYREAIPLWQLKQTKVETWGIENNNGRQRHWLARFRRRTCVVSKTKQAIDLTMFLFAHFHCNTPKNELYDMFWQK